MPLAPTASSWMESISLRAAMVLAVSTTNKGHVRGPDGPEGSCELSSVLQVLAKSRLLLVDLACCRSHASRA